MDSEFQSPRLKCRTDSSQHCNLNCDVNGAMDFMSTLNNAQACDCDNTNKVDNPDPVTSDPLSPQEHEKFSFSKLPSPVTLDDCLRRSQGSSVSHSPGSQLQRSPKRSNSTDGHSTSASSLNKTPDNSTDLAWLFQTPNSSQQHQDTKPKITNKLLKKVCWVFEE